MKNLSLCSAFFLLFFPNLCVAETVIYDQDGTTIVKLSYTLDYHSDKHGVTYTQTIEDEKIQVKIPRVSPDDFKAESKDFIIEVRYNDEEKIIKYPGSKSLISVDVMDAETTEDFCKIEDLIVTKKYLVVTIQLSEKVEAGVEYHYAELFIDVNKMEGDYSILLYDDYKSFTDVPQSLDSIRKETKQICHDDGIEFIDRPIYLPKH